VQIENFEEYAYFQIKHGVNGPQQKGPSWVQTVHDAMFHRLFK